MYHTYHFRIVATNAAGTSFGAEAIFQTAKKAWGGRAVEINTAV
jgi:hypothetical protein